MEENINMKAWSYLARPPVWALKTIQAGRLKGKSDINPQWRYQAMTEVFGPCGVGWRFEIEKLWTQPGPEEQVFAFAEIKLYTYNKEAGSWSEAIPGIGGHMLVPREKAGLHANDEAYKMAVTDALSTAMKMLGVASDIYAGAWDGSKYAEREEPKGFVNKDEIVHLIELIEESGADLDKFMEYMKVETIDTIPKADYKKAVAALNAKKKAK